MNCEQKKYNGQSRNTNIDYFMISRVIETTYRHFHSHWNSYIMNTIRDNWKTFLLSYIGRVTIGSYATWTKFNGPIMIHFMFKLYIQLILNLVYIYLLFSFFFITSFKFRLSYFLFISSFFLFLVVFYILFYLYFDPHELQSYMTSLRNPPS